MSRTASISSPVALALALILPAPAGLLAQGVVRGGALPGPLPLFPADNWWNVDVSRAPLDSASDDFITWINTGGRKRCHPDFGGDSGALPPEAIIFGMVDIVVPSHPGAFLRPFLRTFDHGETSGRNWAKANRYEDLGDLPQNSLGPSLT